MNNRWQSLLRQTWYFKTVFAVTTSLLLIIGSYMTGQLINDMAGIARHEADAGFLLIIYPFLLAGLVIVYWLVLRLVSQRNAVAKVTALVVVGLLAFSSVSIVAQVTA